MSTDRVVIVGVGMLTPVGLSAPETAAAVRARLARFSVSALRDHRFEPFTLGEVPDDALPPLAEPLQRETGLTARAQRMLRLATRPLRECAVALGAFGIKPGLCLALPESSAAPLAPINGATFISQLAIQVHEVFDPRGSDASHAGRAGGLIAIGQAALTVQRGIAQFMLAGGVDTYRDPCLLAALDYEKRIKSDVNWDGFIPGEGAGFLALASEAAATAYGLPVLAHVAPITTGFESGHLYSTDPYRGDGLASTFAQLVARGIVDAPIQDVYSSMTGESHWAKEWGVAFIRNRAIFREEPAMYHPADSYGDTGAASGALLVGLATIGIQGRYHASPALAYGSSDHGARAAIVVSV